MGSIGIQSCGMHIYLISDKAFWIAVSAFPALTKYLFQKKEFMVLTRFSIKSLRTFWTCLGITCYEE